MEGIWWEKSCLLDWEVRKTTFSSSSFSLSFGETKKKIIWFLKKDPCFPQISDNLQMSAEALEPRSGVNELLFTLCARNFLFFGLAQVYSIILKNWKASKLTTSKMLLLTFRLNGYVKNSCSLNFVFWHSALTPHILSAARLIARQPRAHTRPALTQFGVQ